MKKKSSTRIDDINAALCDGDITQSQYEELLADEEKTKLYNRIKNGGIAAFFLAISLTMILS